MPTPANKEIMGIVDALVVIKDPTRDAVAKALKIPLVDAKDTTVSYEYYEGRLPSGSFDHVEAGHRPKTTYGHVFLTARDGVVVKVKDLDLDRFGPVMPPQHNPDDGKEGTTAHRYQWDNGAFMVSFVFTSRSDQLTGVNLMWSAPKQPPKGPARP
jgi:hypothetical protein